MKKSIALTVAALLAAVLFCTPADAGKKRKAKKKTDAATISDLEQFLKGPDASISEENQPYSHGEVFKLFEKVAKEKKVPIDILLAISKHETTYRMHKPDPKFSSSGGWGYMGLGSLNNPKTLKLADKLLKKNDEEDIKLIAETNITASAVIINYCKKKIYKKKAKRKKKINHYHKVLKCYANTGDGFANQLFADEIFMILSKGDSHKLTTGEVIIIEANPALKKFEPAGLDF